MTITVSEARSTICDVVKDAWDAGAATTGKVLLYRGTPGDKPPRSSTTGQPAPFGRVSVQITASEQSTIGSARKYETSGLLTVQVFGLNTDGFRQVSAMAKVLTDALRSYSGTPTTLWFFDVVATEIGEDGPWMQTNVVATFRFEESFA